jgi:hypothetical protein
MSLSSYLKQNGVTCSVKVFIEGTGKHRDTIAKYFKNERQMIDAYIKQYKKGNE